VVKRDWVENEVEKRMLKANDTYTGQNVASIKVKSLTGRFFLD
jgi:hypothetical protein